MNNQTVVRKNLLLDFSFSCFCQEMGAKYAPEKKGVTDAILKGVGYFFVFETLIQTRGRASYRIDTYLKIDSCCR
jgi:hypothetical protein